MSKLTHYAHFSALFSYPTEEFPGQVRALAMLLDGRYPEAASSLWDFAAILPPTDTVEGEALDDIRELYTRSFEVQAITTLDVGYVAFGDDYKRAELLVNLNREFREVQIDCGVELPDHLGNLLRLLAVWKDEALVVEFVTEILHPSIEQMHLDFGPAQMEQRNKLYRKHHKTLISMSEEHGTAYRGPLAALIAVVRQDFGLEKMQEGLGAWVGRSLDRPACFF